MICLSSAGSLTSLHGGVEIGGWRTSHNTRAPRRQRRASTDDIWKDSVAHRPRRQPESRDAHAAHLRRSPLESAASQREASDHAPSIDPRSDRARGGWWRHWRKCTSSGRGSAICVQSLDDSLNSAIRTTYRISLRSSSLLMPRYPSTGVV